MGALATIVLVLALQATPANPAEQLAHAEELACAGRHRDARAAYEKLAHEAPETDEGKLAATRSLPSALLGSCDMVRHGPSENRVDVVVLGDGYEIDHQRAFDELAEDVPPLFERVEPFREYWSYFNFLRGVCVSADGGIDGFGREEDTLLGGRVLGTEAGHVGVDGDRVNAVLHQIPHSDDVAIVFVRLGVLGTGGGGVAVIGGRDALTTVHEWGHAFAGLSDEYSAFTHRRGTVRDGINVAGTDDPKKVPWKHWLAARHPRVGVYEGANGQPMNAWRPTASGCIMNDGEAYCPVCREAIVLRIYSIVDPIEEVVPRTPPPGIREPVPSVDGVIDLKVRTMKPAKHDLEVTWWVEPGSRYPVTPAEPGMAPPDIREAMPMNDRRLRGKLRDMRAEPTKRMRTMDDGECTLRLTREELAPGEYRVTCRVRDTTELRGEKFPWVLKDEYGVLESERVWWIEIR